MQNLLYSAYLSNSFNSLTNEILTTTKGHNHDINLQKLKHNNSNIDLATLYACVKFDLIPSICLFVCVAVLRPSQPNGVMSGAVSLPNHTFTGQA